MDETSAIQFGLAPFGATCRTSFGAGRLAMLGQPFADVQVVEQADDRSESSGHPSKEPSIMLEITMKKILITAALALSALTFAPAAFAQDNNFESVDTDKSGDISLTELQVVLEDWDEAKFKQADTDGNGSLSPEEYALVPGGTGTESLSEDGDTEATDSPTTN